MPAQPQKKKPSMVSHLVHPSLLRGGHFPRRARKRGKTDFCLLNYFFAHSFQSKHFPCHKMKFYPKSKKCFLKTNHTNQLWLNELPKHRKAGPFTLMPVAPFFWRRGSLTAYLRKLVALGIKLLCPNVVALVSFLTVQKLRKLHHDFWTDLALVDLGTPMQWPGHKQNFVNGGIGTYFS